MSTSKIVFWYKLYSDLTFSLWIQILIAQVRGESQAGSDLPTVHSSFSFFCTHQGKKAADSVHFYFSFSSPSLFPTFLPPSGPIELSSVCGGVSPVPPVLSLSRSIKRRRTHAGCLKSPQTLPYGWWTGRCSNHTTLSRREEHPSHLLLYPSHWLPS